MKKKDIWISVTIIAGAVLAFYYYSRGRGYIKIDASGAELQLRSGWITSTEVTSEAERARVRAGVYRPQRLCIIRKQDGNTWRLDSHGPWGELAKIKVKNNETTALRLGPPFLIRPGVRQSSSQISIDFSIIGQAGEHYGNVITKNGQRVSTPGVKILDEAGSVLAAGKFEYG